MNTTSLPSPDDAVDLIGRVLRALNGTNVSPLISCKNSANVDLLESFDESHRAGRKHQYFLASWLETFLSGNEHTLSSEAVYDIFNADNDFTCDDENMVWEAGLSLLHSILTEDTTPAPHEILSVVMESYYCRADNDLGGPSFDSMFILHSLLSAYSIQSAESMTRHSLQYSETIRWRRLKSMVEDTVALFEKMLYDVFEVVNDTFENDTQLHYVKPSHFIAIATWIYTKQIFPACQSLTSLLLRENHGDVIASLEDGVVAKLFGLLTKLLALECTETSREELNNTDRLLLAAIIESDDFFRYVRSFIQTGSTLNESGLSLEEDLLLYDRQHHNKLGNAKFAYIKLQSQLHPSKNNNAAIYNLPSPLSGGYRWALSFPHVTTLLADENMSHVEIGLDMLQMLINETHFIRPAKCCTHYTDSAVERGHSSELLTDTLHTLLSLVLRISALEASMANSSIVLTYSSLQVMNMAQQLLQSYDANLQVETIFEVSQQIREPDQCLITLLPKLLDWLRPVITDVCNRYRRSCKDSDLDLLHEVIGVLDPILMDLDKVFDESTMLPGNVPGFFSMIEAYTSSFSLLRAMKMFVYADNVSFTTNEQSKSSTEHALSFISQWLTQSLNRIIVFKERLENLIDIWSTETEASSLPQGHHRCFLLHYHLEEAVLELSGTD